MASRGFEFAYMLDGGKGTPVSRDFILSTAAAHLRGDLMTIASDGDITAVTSTTTEVTCVMAEPVASADITAGTTKAKAYIITREQVWRCSMDGATATGKVGATKVSDTADKNTISATDVSGGAMILVNTSRLDEDGNVLAYVVFSNTTFAGTN